MMCGTQCLTHTGPCFAVIWPFLVNNAVNASKQNRARDIKKCQTSSIAPKLRGFSSSVFLLILHMKKKNRSTPQEGCAATVTAEDRLAKPKREACAL